MRETNELHANGMPSKPVKRCSCGAPWPAIRLRWSCSLPATTAPCIRRRCAFSAIPKTPRTLSRRACSPPIAICGISRGARSFPPGSRESSSMPRSCAAEAAARTSPFRSTNRREEQVPAAERFPDEGPSPEEIYAGYELGERLRENLEGLSPVLRRAFELRAIAGLTADEAAKALGVSRNTLKARLWRARHQLAARLSGFLTGSTQGSRRTNPLAANLANAAPVAGD